MGAARETLAERFQVNVTLRPEHTVHRHVTNILRKLDLSSRTAAAAYVLRSGLLDNGGPYAT
jgi:hypothetical protein